MEILGVDIGGSGMKAAIVDIRTGELLSDRHRIPTPKPSTPAAVAQTFKQLVEDLNWKGPIGCSFPCVVKRGKCMTHGNLSPEWLDVQVDELFQQQVPGSQVVVSNDADLAGIAEVNLGAGKGHPGKVLMVTIGTGLGTGLFFNGTLVPNLELGRVYYTDGDVFERYAADSARKREELSLKEWAKRFNKFLRHANLICSPDLFIIGGGISKKFEKFESYFNVDVPVVPAKFKNNAGIIGAAIYGAEQIVDKVS